MAPARRGDPDPLGVGSDSSRLRAVAATAGPFIAAAPQELVVRRAAHCMVRLPMAPSVRLLAVGSRPRTGRNLRTQRICPRCPCTARRAAGCCRSQPSLGLAAWPCRKPCPGFPGRLPQGAVSLSPCVVVAEPSSIWLLEAAAAIARARAGQLAVSVQYVPSNLSGTGISWPAPLCYQPRSRLWPPPARFLVCRTIRPAFRPHGARTALRRAAGYSLRPPCLLRICPAIRGSDRGRPDGARSTV
jgi:hypothetical protein